MCKNYDEIFVTSYDSSYGSNYLECYIQTSCVLKTSPIIFLLYCTLIRKTYFGSWKEMRLRDLSGENIILTCLNKIYRKKTYKGYSGLYRKCIAVKRNFRFLFVPPYWKFFLLVQNMFFKK